jgi:hypothetical protein
MADLYNLWNEIAQPEEDDAAAGLSTDDVQQQDERVNQALPDDDVNLDVDDDREYITLPSALSSRRWSSSHPARTALIHSSADSENNEEANNYYSNDYDGDDYDDMNHDNANEVDKKKTDRYDDEDRMDLEDLDIDRNNNIVFGVSHMVEYVHPKEDHDATVDTDIGSNDDYETTEKTIIHVTYQQLMHTWKQEMQSPILLPVNENMIQSWIHVLFCRENEIDEIDHCLDDDDDQRNQSSSSSSSSFKNIRRNFPSNNSNVRSLFKSILRMDLDRARYVLCDLLRLRLSKITDFPLFYLRDATARTLLTSKEVSEKKRIYHHHCHFFEQLTPHFHFHVSQSMHFVVVVVFTAHFSFLLFVFPVGIFASISSNDGKIFASDGITAFPSISVEIIRYTRDD